nr:MAG TPA: hypothetical protein [Caudoviricetes sp.]
MFFGSAIPNTENTENVGYWIYNSLYIIQYIVLVLIIYLLSL